MWKSPWIKTLLIMKTGYFKTQIEIGHGVWDEGNSSPQKGTLTWHFKPPMVHDFMWAAVPNYQHDESG